jgi:hypothetical protein
MSAAQPADHRLDIGIELPRLGMRPVGMVSQRGQTAGPVFAEPVVHRLARHPVTAGDLSDRGAGHDFHDRVIALLHDPQLHKHGPAAFPPRTTSRSEGRPGRGGVKHQVKPRWTSSSGVRKELELVRISLT